LVINIKIENFSISVLILFADICCVIDRINCYIKVSFTDSDNTSPLHLTKAISRQIYSYKLGANN
jgi:hypothetical protein